MRCVATAINNLMATVHIDIFLSGGNVEPFLVVPTLYRGLSDHDSKVLQMQYNLCNQESLPFAKTCLVSTADPGMFRYLLRLLFGMMSYDVRVSAFACDIYGRGCDTNDR